MIQIIEEWRDVVGYEGYYQVSSGGRVKSVARVVERSSGPQFVCERILKQASKSAGKYQGVSLTRNGKTIRYYVHRLVLDAWEGPLPGGMVSRHLNGESTDNRRVNLTYGTPQENSHDMVSHGRNNVGKTHCPRGHEYAGDNLLRNSRGGRSCLRCRRAGEALRRKGPRPEQTHCKHGHELAEANIYRRPGSSRRECRACRMIAVRKYQRKLALR